MTTAIELTSEEKKLLIYMIQNFQRINLDLIRRINSNAPKGMSTKDIMERPHIRPIIKSSLEEIAQCRNLLKKLGDGEE